MSDGPPALQPRRAWSLRGDRALIRRRNRAALWPLALAVLMLVIQRVVRTAPDLVTPLGLAATLSLAYANGANDVSKAIATLVGAGVTDYRRAMRWGVLWTVSGAALSAVAARALVVTFSAGFLARGVHIGPAAALAIVLGALGWVLLATRTGLPVSTTHALTGAIVGVGAMSSGVGGVAWSKLAQKIAWPLAASPLLAVVLGLAALALVRAVPGQAPLTPLHWLSSGAAGLARGLNDAPKIVALGAGFAVATGHGAVPLWLVLAVAVAMGAGSWAGGRRVTQTLAERVTRLDDREGLGANLATALVRSPSAPAPTRPGRSG